MRLIAENLGGERGGETVFSGVDFALEDGEALVVTGPNGAGKSTLLRVIAGLLPRQPASVRLDGGGETFPTVAAACHYLGHLNAHEDGADRRREPAFWRDFSAMRAVWPSTRRWRRSGSADRPSAIRLSLHRPEAARGDREAAGSHRPVWLLEAKAAARISRRLPLPATISAIRTR